jgi:hypothetical protein
VDTGIDAVCWKMVPRVSLAKYRVPVPPGVCGSAIDWYELAGAADVGWLHAEVVVPMSIAPDAFPMSTL